MAVHPSIEVSIPVDGVRLAGALTVPDGAVGVVAFAHGSGSSRHSPRNRRVAAALNDHRLATLLFDLLDSREEEIDSRTGELRFDIPFLADPLGVGCFGASTGAAAALVAAGNRPELVRAVVSRGGRPDLAADALEAAKAPTLLIVGGKDEVVLGLNERARARMRSEVMLEVVPGAGHLFEEPGALERVELLARTWFERWLGAKPER